MQTKYNVYFFSSLYFRILEFNYKFKNYDGLRNEWLYLKTYTKWNFFQIFIYSFFIYYDINTHCKLSPKNFDFYHSSHSILFSISQFANGDTLQLQMCPENMLISQLNKVINVNIFYIKKSSMNWVVIQTVRLKELF